MNYQLFVVNLIAIFVFLYIFWKKLKDDYIANQIFSTAIFVILGYLAGIALSIYWDAKWIFWIVLTTQIIGLVFGIVKYRLKIYESIEAFIIAVFPWYLFIILFYAITRTDWMVLGHSVFILLSIVVYLYLNKSYKKFTWYKSGKVGFAGLISLALYFLIRAVIAFIFPGMLFFGGGLEPLLSVIISIILFSVSFRLSRI